MYHNQSKGKSAEILFELLCMEQGWQCCKPITDFMQYDYIIDRGNGFEKIQVKTVFFDKKKKKFRCDLRKNKSKSRNKTKYCHGDFDTVAISVDARNWILIPWESVKNNSEININDKRIQNERSWHISVDIEKL